jgi:GT2 family glycosyltransferase
MRIKYFIQKVIHLIINQEYKLFLKPILPEVDPSLVKDKVLIIIVCFKYLKRLRYFLDSIKRYKEDFPYDIVVVNNQSRKDIRQFLLENRINFFERKNKFQNDGAWVEAIIKFPNYRYFLCLDDDVYVVRHNWLTNFVNIFEEDSKVGAVGNYYARFKDFYHIGHDKYEKRLKYILLKNKLIKSMEESIDHVQSSAIMFKHEALKVSGLWYLFKPDDKFATNISEVEISLRLRNNGLLVKSLDEVSFGHRDFQYETLPDNFIGFSKCYSIIHDK